MFFAGLAQGVNDAASASRKEEYAHASQQAEQENSILLHLAQTHPDADIRAKALTGLLNQNIGKPEKGLKGFFGKLEGRPELPTIRALMAQGKPQQTEPAPGRLPEGASAALPAGSPTEPGGPPMSLGAVHNTLPQAPGASTTVPRQGFLSPQETIRTSESAKEQGRLDTLRTMNPAERQALFGHASAISHTVDDKGTVHYFQNGLEVNAVPGAGKSTPAPKPSGPEAQALERAREIQAEAEGKGLPPISADTALQQARTESRGRTAAADTTKSAQLSNLKAQGLRLWQQAHGATPMTLEQSLTTAKGVLPTDSTEEDVAGLAQELRQTSQGGGTPATAPPPGVTPATAGGTTPTTRSGAATAVTPPPSASSNIIRNVSRRPPSPQIQRAVGQAKSTLDLLDSAVAALEPFKGDNTLDGALKLAKDYRAGVYDPVNSAATGLADLAGLQASGSTQLTQGAPRTMQYFVARKQHVPRIPSGRQTMASGVLPGNIIQGGSVALGGDEGGFDSPASQYDKLTRARANVQNFIREAEAATLSRGAVPAAMTGAPPTAPLQKPIPGVPGGLAESTDGGKTWRRVK